MAAAVHLPGWRHLYSGKVRDLYLPADANADGDGSDRMLVVASDRVSAFDYVLEPAIPGKGALLTALSRWWFDQLTDIPNHLVAGAVPDAVRDRSMLVRKLRMQPIECVVRGYLTGSGWAEYRESGTVCGIALPAGLGDGDRLPEPIFTPAFKAPMGEHDENISFARSVELVGAETATELREVSLRIYARAAAMADERGLILADTKFEFGVDADGTLTLADEVLTSDSTRYWDASAWHRGQTPAERMASFDKQIVRDWLRANWDRTGDPPPLPEHIVQQTADRYRELLERMVGAYRVG